MRRGNSRLRGAQRSNRYSVGVAAKKEEIRREKSCSADLSEDLSEIDGDAACVFSWLRSGV